MATPSTAEGPSAPNGHLRRALGVCNLTSLSKEVFGDFHGFLCGWCYWTTNMFFIPTLLFYLAGVITYAGGPRFAGLAENRPFFLLITIGLLWLTVLANIFGLGVGKWVNNAGGIGALIAAAVLVLLAAVLLFRYTQPVPGERLVPGKVDWKVISSFGVICFSLVGLELGPVMGDEIRDPQRTVPRGIFWGGVLSGALYIGATLSILLAVPPKDVTVIQGILQGVDKMTSGTGSRFVLAPLAIVFAISIAGSSSR